MTSLRSCDPDLRRYLLKHRLPDVFEAILTALAINCPDDPHEFILEKLNILLTKQEVFDDLRWDSFIEKRLAKKKIALRPRTLDFLWSYEDENSQPTPEMYQKAYNLYNSKLKDSCFKAWLKFHYHMKRKKMILTKQLNDARTWYRLRILKIRLKKWIEWVAIRKERQRAISTRIQRVVTMSLLRLVFKAWQGVAADARRTKEYFERIEKGEIIDGGEGGFIAVKGDGPGDQISTLPRHVALRIFSFLSVGDLGRCSRVCRAWKMIVQANILWSKVDMSQVKHRATNKVTAKLVNKCRPFLGHLNLRGCYHLTKESLRFISQCRNLQDLNLSDIVGVTDEVMKEIAMGCTSLLYLNIASCQISDATLRYLARLIGKQREVLRAAETGHNIFVTGQAWTEKSFIVREIFRRLKAQGKCVVVVCSSEVAITVYNDLNVYCTNMQYLSLAYCTKFTNKGLSYMANGKGCHKVVYLDISGCGQITEEGYRFMARGCSNLNTLLLNDLPNLRDECIQSLTSECRTLRALSILNSPFLSDVAFKCLATCRRISKFRIEGNNRITDAAIKVLAKSCPLLDHMYLVDCPRLTDLSLKALACCKHLHMLNVADCVRIQDTGVRQIVEGPSGAKIKELNLTNCVRVSDVTLLRIAQRCHALVYASFCYCEHVTDAGVELLGTLPSLISLDLSGCNIQDQGVAALGNNPQFRDIIISECSNITDLGLQKMCQQCRMLENLDISHCSRITDNAIKNLAFCCRLLRTLNIAGCTLLTDSSLQYLSGVCHYLETLDLSGCVRISDKALRYLRKGCRKLNSLTLLYCKNVTKSAVQKLHGKCEYVMHSTDDPRDIMSY